MNILIRNSIVSRLLRWQEQNNNKCDPMPSRKKSSILRATGISLFCLISAPSFAETLEGALVKAYQSNPELNSQRASVRATDEDVSRAKSGYRPRITASADAGRTYYDVKTSTGIGSDGYLSPRGVGLQINQNLFNGFGTTNSVKAAESNVFGSREALRNVEQNILFNAAQAYMNVLRDTAILRLQRNNVEVLEEQLRQTRDRFNVGEVTRTDVAQAEARLAGARSSISAAEGNLRSSVAIYRQVVGTEPSKLNPGKPLDKILPRTLEAAVSLGLREHPAIIAALHSTDAAEFQVKVAQSEFAPSLDVSGAVQQRYDYADRGDERLNASVVATLTVPIYQGGEVSARVRQFKEQAGQAQLQVDVMRDQVRAAIVSAWGQLEAAKAQVIAAVAEVAANTTALEGVREEARVGQRTTLDVLNAQQELLNSRVNLIMAQRDRVVASYAVAQAMGRLSVASLSLKISEYDPSVHYEQVKGMWVGTTIPDGR